MSLYFPTPNTALAGQEADDVIAAADPAVRAADAGEQTGILQVALPLRGAQVNVYDHANQLVSTGVVGDQAEPVDQQHTTEMSLPAGIYYVETVLGDMTARRLVPIRANFTTRVAEDQPTQQAPLVLNCSAPLIGTADFRERHAAAAEKWSATTTWPSSPGGGSRLFLFVRTLASDPNPAFASGLKLLDSAGRLVTDFSIGTRHDTAEGWSAFSADLPPGAYVFRRGGRHVSLRFQALYLAAGWETQVFLTGERYPRLHSQTVSMAPLGTGFHRGDDRALTAIVLLAGLTSGQGDAFLIPGPATSLLEGKLTNPWLNIVAAHALNRSMVRPQTDTAIDSAALRQLRDRVLASLAPLRDHPDASALIATANPVADREAPRAFWSPPMLLRSLQLINQHATTVAATIPDGSLTDLVLDGLIISSPWVAWHTLDRPPLSDPMLETTPGHGRSLLKIRPASQDVVATITRFTGALTRGASPAAPVFYQQTASPKDSDLQVAAILPAILTTAGSDAEAGMTDPTVQVAQTIIRPGQTYTVPHTIAVNIDQSLRELIGRADPSQISADLGVPLARTEQSVSRLTEQPEGDAVGAAPVTTNRLTPADDSVIAYSLDQTLRQMTQSLLASRSRSRQTTHVVFIEDVVPPLLEAADRLRLAAARMPGQESDAANRASEVAQRAHRVADALLASAGHTTLSDADGRIVFGNGAYNALLAHATRMRGDDQDPVEQDRLEAAAQRAWEVEIKKQPPGEHDVEVPARFGHHAGEVWRLQRTAVVDEASGETRAFLNVLHNPDGQRITGKILRQLSPLASQLTVSVSLVAYGSPDERDTYLQEVDDLASQLEDLIGAVGT